MYTECSHCNAVFLITAAQMDAAGGRVRCGHCGEVFSAREVQLSGWSHVGSEEPVAPRPWQAPQEAPQPPPAAEPAPAPVETVWPQADAAALPEKRRVAHAEVPVDAPQERPGAFAAWRERRAARKAGAAVAAVDESAQLEPSREELAAEEAMGDETASLDLPQKT